MRFIDASGQEYVPTGWLTFNDVLLRPQESCFSSRNDCSITTGTYLTGSSNGPLYSMSIPIISANMDTVTGPEMAIAMFNLGGLGILHRFYSSADEYFKAIEQVYNHTRHSVINTSRNKEGEVAFSIGCNGSCRYNESKNWIDFVQQVIDTFPAIRPAVCIDVAHGGMKQVSDTVSHLREKFPRNVCCIIAGNVATGPSAVKLADAGADVLKVGIGSGSCCSTRLVTGHGVPQLSAIMEVRQDLEARGHNNIGIIADGGIRQSGDMVKAFAVGANAVMLGGLLAGTDEAPGRVEQYNDGSRKKLYRGQSSRHFLDEIGKDGVASEGVSIEMPYKGSVKDIISELVGGIRSGLTYSGVSCLEELYDKSELIEISHHGWIESTPHIMSNSLS